ncbi:MAG: aldehyde dehydrogenase [Alphaproteobacteria bacterium]|nr:aldehyde dehydrogenase [Alphaproteobacteria bacterium]
MTPSIDPHPALERRDVVARLLRDRGDLLVVTGLGAATYDAAAAGDDAANFYLWGAMGSAATVGLGLAVACPDRAVLVLTGDGEMLMGLGALATIGVRRPANLTIAVLDNRLFGETGRQPSHTADGVSLTAVAEACGFAWVGDVRDNGAVAELRERLHSLDAGARFAQIHIGGGMLERVLPPRDGAVLKNRFRAAVSPAGGRPR